MKPTMTRTQRKISPSKPKPPCGVLIFYHHDDHTTAQHLQETVHTLAPNASCRLLTPQNVPLETDAFLFSVQVWLLVSECAVRDPLMMLYKDELIMKSIISGRNQFIPVFTKPKDLFINLPCGLAAYMGLTLTNSNLSRAISRMLNNANHQAYKQQLTAEYNHQCSEWAKCEELACEKIINPNAEKVACFNDQNEENLNTREEPANEQQRNVFNITINGNPKIYCQDSYNINMTEIPKKPSEDTPRHKDTTEHQDSAKALFKDTQPQENMTEVPDIPVGENDDTESLQSEPIPSKKARRQQDETKQNETEMMDNDDDDILSLHSDANNLDETNEKADDEGQKGEGENENINIEDLFEDDESESQGSSSRCNGRTIVYNIVINHPKEVNIGNYHY